MQKRVLLGNFSEFEVKKHTGLPWEGATEIYNWLGPYLEPKAERPILEQIMERIKHSFFEKSGMRNILGIIDGSNVNIVAPHKNESSFVNRKQNHSINTNYMRLFILFKKWS